MTPKHIRDYFQEILNDVSDETGQTTRGRYLLKYEGWSPGCFPSHLKHDDAMYNYAARQTPKIVKEWQQQLPNYKLLELGYQETGLYGVTFAIFERVI